MAPSTGQGWGWTAIIPGLGLLPDEVECVRLNHEIFEPGPAPFRARVARNTFDRSPLRSLDRHTDRAGEVTEEGPSPEGGPARM